MHWPSLAIKKQKIREGDVNSVNFTTTGNTEFYDEIFNFLNFYNWFLQ